MQCTCHPKPLYAHLRHGSLHLADCHHRGDRFFTIVYDVVSLLESRAGVSGRMIQQCKTRGSVHSGTALKAEPADENRTTITCFHPLHIVRLQFREGRDQLEATALVPLGMHALLRGNVSSRECPFVCTTAISDAAAMFRCACMMESSPGPTTLSSYRRQLSSDPHRCELQSQGSFSRLEAEWTSCVSRQRTLALLPLQDASCSQMQIRADI